MFIWIHFNFTFISILLDDQVNRETDQKMQRDKISKMEPNWDVLEYHKRYNCNCDL